MCWLIWSKMLLVLFVVSSISSLLKSTLLYMFALCVFDMLSHSKSLISLTFVVFICENIFSIKLISSINKFKLNFTHALHTSIVLLIILFFNSALSLLLLLTCLLKNVSVFTSISYIKRNTFSFWATSASLILCLSFWSTVIAESSIFKFDKIWRMI
jgi:hypothetical protein